MSTILIQNLPTIEVRDGLIHFTGADSGIEYALTRHLFFKLTMDAVRVMGELGGGGPLVIKGEAL